MTPIEEYKFLLTVCLQLRQSGVIEIGSVQDLHDYMDIIRTYLLPKPATTGANPSTP